MKRLYSLIFIFVMVGMFMVSCDDENYTGYSELTPSSPTITADLTGFTGGVTSSEIENTFEIPITMSEPQIVDVAVYITQIDGDATEGEDFSIDNNNSRVFIAAGETTGTASITILEDDIAEGTETFTIQIGDDRTANASMTPATVSFTINNTTADDLVVGLEWYAEIFDLAGSEIDPTDIADLRLLVTTADMPYDTITDSADGGSFEELTITGADWEDGEYYIVADFYSAEDFGNQGTVDLDLTVTFDQAGVINGETYSFPAALNTGVTCALNHFYLASVTKSGSNYTISSIGEAYTPDFDGLAGTYDVLSSGESTDGAPTNNPITDFPYTVTITHEGDGTYTISDGMAGVYQEWYCAAYNACNETEGTFDRDACNDLTGEWVDPFGANVYLSGSVASDGTIEIYWENDFGDYIDAVYTPQ